MADEVQMDEPQAFQKFPPFPSPPPGVTIIPFKDFKPRGIQINMNSSENAVEIDALGIPTVELRVKHETDESKSGAGPKKSKKKKRKAPGDEPEKRKTWWELWEDAEDQRVTSDNFLHSTASPVDRLTIAAEDFRSKRTWPPIVTKVPELWDSFRRYIGLLAIHTTKGKTKKASRAAPDEDADFYSDEEEEAESTAPQKPDEEAAAPEPEPESTAPTEAYIEEVLEDDPLVDDGVDALTARMQAFIDDPELSMRIFFSSHMRDKGLIWSERNLTYLPRLASFFIHFLLRSRVFPASYTPRFEAALAIVDQALRELPLTYKIGQSLTDGLSDALREIYGTKSPGAITLESPVWDSGLAGDGTEETTAEAGQERKRQKTDGPVDIDRLKEKQLEDELKAGNLHILDPNLQTGHSADAAMDVDANEWGAIPGGWGATPVGWSQPWNTDTQPGPWTSSFGEAGEESDRDDGNENTWDQPPPTEWPSPAVPPLTDLMGPTALPLTHETGVVEQSLRRIKAVIPATTAVKKDSVPKKKNKSRKKAPGDGDKDSTEPKVEDQVAEEVKATAAPVSKWSGKEGAEAVEEDLERLFTKVVLEPWPNWDKSGESDIREPVILPSSRAGSDGFHDPRKDDIILLVKPEVAAGGLLAVGIGIGATWVQIAQRKDDTSTGPGRFWYMEQLVASLPSYYVEADVVPKA